MERMLYVFVGLILGWASMYYIDYEVSLQMFKSFLQQCPNLQYPI